MILDILFTLFLVFLNGFFVAAEFAIVKVRLSQIEMRARSGNFFAGMAKDMVNKLDAYLSATQLGITLASLGLGWVGESVVAVLVLDAFAAFGYTFSPELAHKISFPIAFAIITVLHIVLGELAPKSLAIQRSESVTLAVSIPMKGFYFLFRPFIWVLNNLANWLLRKIGIDPAKEQELHSAEELRYILEESSRGGMIESSDHRLIENVFDFAATTANQIMVPRTQIVALELGMTSQEIMEQLIEEGYSRLPVYEGSIDNIIGVVYAKDIITLLCHQNLIILQDIIRPAYFVQETEKINTLLQNLQRRRNHMAIVIDEFGGTAGIVTLENIIEEIVGQIQDEYDEETPLVQKNSENEYTVHATAAIADLNEILPRELPESEDYETIGGLVNHFAGRIPELNDEVQIPGYTCTILQRSMRSLELVKLKVAYTQKEEEEERLKMKKLDE
ncbi:MAG TPA: hemolysin family protein [Patescibacteria group bacterium]|nr:hemolysin family protein [Patescibacteria group bacterium]